MRQRRQTNVTASSWQAFGNSPVQRRRSGENCGRMEKAMVKVFQRQELAIRSPGLATPRPMPAHLGF
jgi:hypothetical protein